MLHRSELLIVMYHGVTDDRSIADRWWHHVHVDDFRRQIRYLTSHYDVRHIDDALGSLWTGGARRTACITFDDGYLNNKTVALPVLREFSAPATIYLATGMVGTNRLLWTVELDAAIKSGTTRSIELSAFGMGRKPLTDRASRVDVFDQIVELVKALPRNTRTTALQDLFGSVAPPDRDPLHRAFAMMQWSDAADLAKSGLITFGGHTVNHEIVSRLNDDEVRYEITQSMREVEGNLTATTRTFAYPNGSRDDFDERAVNAVQTAGGIAAVSTIEGLQYADDDRFAIKRIGIGSDTTFDQFRLHTSGLIPDVKRLTRRKG